MHLIKLKNVSKYYKSEDNVSVGMKNISVGFDYNEFVAITGSSGSGKTTMLNVISGLDGYEDGEVLLNGEETSHYTIADWEKYRAAYVGFVFQNYNIIDSYTVLENVMLALDIQNYPRKLRKKRALELIEKVGLLSHKNHKASKLSGGQKQRTVIARALAKDCPIIVADEPTGNLDSESGNQIMSLLHEISKDKLVIVVTHNYTQVEPYATRRIKMHDGVIVEDKVIKKTHDSNTIHEAKQSKMGFLSILNFAVKNLFAQPKRFIFILLLQFIVVAALTFVYTSQIQRIREAGLANSALFQMVPDNRLIVIRRDGLEMSEADIEYLEKLPDVKKVYKHGENFKSFQNQYIRRDWTTSIQYIDAAKTVSKRHIEGRMPVAENEVLVSRGLGGYIGETIYITGYPAYYMSNKESVHISEDEQFYVTGIVDTVDSVLYLSDEYLANPNKNKTYLDAELYVSMYDQITYGDEKEAHIGDNRFEILDYYFNDEMIIDEIYGNDYIYGGVIQNHHEDAVEVEIEWTFVYYDYKGYPIVRQDFKITTTEKIIINPNLNEESLLKAIIIGEKRFEDIKTEVLDQVYEYAKRESPKTTALIVGGRASGNRLLKNIDTDTYRIFYPANVKDPLRPVYVFLFTLLAIVTIGLVGSFLYTILHAVTKNVMAARQKDFAIYRSIGANKKDLGRLVIIEQVILSIFALILVIIAFNILSYYVLSIARIVDYLIWSDYIALFIIFAIFGALLGMRFNRKVFNQTVVETLSLAKEDILWLNLEV